MNRLYRIREEVKPDKFRVLFDKAYFILRDGEFVCYDDKTVMLKLNNSRVSEVAGHFIVIHGFEDRPNKLKKFREIFCDYIQ